MLVSVCDTIMEQTAVGALQAETLRVSAGSALRKMASAGKQKTYARHQNDAEAPMCPF